jgi:Tfp pilus assembly protein PilO
MDRNRLWMIGSVVVAIAVIAAGWFLGIQPQLATAAIADQDRAKAQIQNTANEALLVSLKKDYRGIDALKTTLASLRESVPASTEISTFVTELDSLAGAHQVTVSLITVADATAYAPPVPAASTPTPSPGATATPSATPTPTPLASAAPSAGTVQVTNPKITAANFIAIPVNLSITGQYANVLDFVKGLQTGPRLFLVTSLSVTTVEGGVDSSIGGLVYVLLQDGTNATATPAG